MHKNLHTPSDERHTRVVRVQVLLTRTEAAAIRLAASLTHRSVSAFLRDAGSATAAAAAEIDTRTEAP